MLVFITILITWKCFLLWDVALQSRWTMFTVLIALFTKLHLQQMWMKQEIAEGCKGGCWCLLLLRNNFSSWQPITEVALFWSFSAFFMSWHLAVGKSSSLHFILNFWHWYTPWCAILFNQLELEGCYHACHGISILIPLLVYVVETKQSCVH